MADGSTFFAAPTFAAGTAFDTAPDILLFHDGDFHDPTRLPGRALRMLAVTTQLRLPAIPPLRPGIDQPGIDQPRIDQSPAQDRPLIARRP